MKRFGAPLTLLLLFVLLTAPAACSRSAPDARPEGAVHLWIERTEASLDDRRAAREAYALLGPVARKNLEDRAERASRVQGRQVEPFEMLAEGRYGFHFRPKAMTSTIKGDDAIVDVRGQNPELEQAQVHCHLENGVWRIEPGIPEPSAPQRREDAGG